VLTLTLHAQGTTAKPSTNGTSTAKKSSRKPVSNTSTAPVSKDNKEIHWLSWEQMQEEMKKSPEESIRGCIYRLVWMVQTYGCQHFSGYQYH
jgi:hypothetical protein